MSLITIPCRCNCGRQVTVESRWVRSAHNESREFLAFASRRCQLRFVASEGTKAVLASLVRQEQEDLINAGYSDPVELSESQDH